MSQDPGKKLRLFLVRHGNTFEEGETSTQIGRRSDLPLTAKGREQIRQLGSYLSARGLRPAAIYSGALCRQTGSARILEGCFDPAPPVHCAEPALDELDYGDWEGLTVAELTSRYGEAYEGWVTRAAWPEGIFGEAFEERQDRLRAWIETISRAHRPGEIVVAVSSTGIIRLFYSLLATAWSDIVRERRAHELQVKTGHFCELELQGQALAVRVWNIMPK